MKAVVHMANAVEMAGVVKRFGGFQALRELDFEVKEGEVHGFLGPNGAGKSTSIRVLLGLLRHDSGTVRLLGGEPWTDAVTLHRRLAYVPGDVVLWPELSGGETLDLLLRLRGTSHSKRKAELIERFNLDPSKKASAYSKGNRQKVALIAAFSANVDLLILDEPTSGLDPLMSAVFEECVSEESRNGRTVLLSSHILSEVEALCDRITIIREGRAIESGTIDQLRHLTRTSIVVELKGGPGGLDKLAGVHGLTREGNRVSFQVDSERISEIVAELSKLGVISLKAQPPSLEELFLRHYQRSGGVA